MHEHDHNCGCGHDHDHDHEHIITLTLDDNTELECIVMSIFPVDNKNYIALLPVDSVESEEGEIYLYQYLEHDDNQIELLNIEDDDEFEAVSEVFDELLDEAEFDELFDDDDLFDDENED